MLAHARLSALTATAALLLTLASPAVAQAPQAPPELPGIPQIGEIQVTQMLRYVQAVHDADVAAYQAVVDAVARDRAFATSNEGPMSPQVTGACGGATNGADAYISRESGGDPNVYNSGGSGAWGCYQLMPEHFAPGGACDDMVYGQATPAQQAECASRLPLSAWGG